MNDLLERLKALRRSLADERKVPAYVIFHDSTLIEMAESRPATLEELRNIKGIGPQKMEDFGELFLKVIRDDLEKNPPQKEESSAEEGTEEPAENEGPFSVIGAIFVDPAKDGVSDEIITDLGKYYSKKAWDRDRSNQRYPEHSAKILAAKDCFEEEILEFVSMIDPLLQDDVYLARVPSHAPGKQLTGIRVVAEEIVAREDGRVDATACLERIYKIAKKSTGGDRSLEVDLNSIRVSEPELIKEKKVLVIDDVTTSGNSLRACRELLLQAGAKRVKMLALGKTVRGT